MVAGSLAWMSTLLCFLLVGCTEFAGGPSRPGTGQPPFLIPITDRDLGYFLATQTPQYDSPPIDGSPQFKKLMKDMAVPGKYFSKEFLQFLEKGDLYVWDDILGPRAKARYQTLAKAPCAFSIDEQVHFMKSDELTSDEELDKIYLTYYCVGRERSRTFMDAARIRLKQQYPALSEGDLNTLAAEELKKEKAQWVLEQKLLFPSHGLACASNRVGGYTYTDCY